MSDYDDNTEPAGASTSETIPSFSVTPGLPIGGNGGAGNSNAARSDGGYSLGRTPNMHIPVRPNGAGGAGAGGDSIYAAGRTPVVSIAPRPGEMTEFGGNGGGAGGAGAGGGSGSGSGTRPGSSSELGAFGSAMRWQNAMSGASTTSVYDDDDMSDDGHSHATLNTSPEAFDNSKMMQTSGGDAPQLRQHELTTNPLRENFGNGVEWRKDMLDVSLRPPPTDDEETLNTRTKDWGWGQFFLALAVLAISSVVLFCNTVSKLSLSAMINQYRLMEGNSETTDIERHVAFLMLLLVIMLPQGVGFIISLWNSCYKASARNPSPSGRALLWTLFQSLAESIGICLFVLYVGVRIDPLFCIVMMNGTFSVPSFARLRRLNRQRKGYEQVPLMSAINGSRQSVLTPPRKPSVWDKVLYAGSSVLQVVALGFIPIYLWRQGMTVDVCILSAVSMFLLSTAWLPDLQYKMMEPTKARYDMDTDQFHPSRRTEDALKTRTKTAIYACFGRILFTVIFATVYFKLDKRLGKIGVADMFANLSSSPLFTPFLIQLFTSFFGYHAARCACMMSVQVTGFALPLYLATPLTLAIALTTCSNFPFHLDWACTGTVQTMWLIIIGTALWFSEIMLTLKTAWNRSTPRVALDESLFFQPSYNGVFLEQFTILNRRPPDQGPKVLTAEEEFERSKIYICTTMYREARDEMKNTVSSLLEMDRAMNEMCESHIIMDGGAQGGTLGKFAIQLVTVLKECLMEKFHEQKGTYALKDPLDMENWLAENGQRIETPYGLRLEFKLPYGMFMIMHLKDPSRVKKKKRWSQVLYMYYFLQFRAPSHIPHDQAAYILTTDADIKFRPQDVTALLALLTRDHRVGAVCGRTFPIGEGPLYWYQIFDYAVGHWFQKTAEHVLGSVLCCPGCFSMFRCDALRDTLKEYSTEVNEAVEFLTKDMGEDRWLCTLLVLAGWRLDYTAVAYDETHCPTSFDEFFNQRRRWIPSTLANILQLIKKWRIATRNNDSMSSFFMFYQCAMLFSSMVSPATVLLVIMGGLHYANTFSLDWIFGWLCGLVGIFVVACLFASQNVQLWLAKLFTLIFALVMGAVTVGVAAEIGSEFHKQSTPDSGEPTSAAPHTTTPPRRVDGDLSNFTTAAMTTLINNGTTIATTTSSFISEVFTTLSPQHMLGDGLDGFNGYQVSVSTVYLGAIIGMFLIAGLFHPDEAKALLHGVWYLLCLPGGYLFLLIYAFANLNDRSWGTREEANQQKLQGSWIDEVMRGCGRHPEENIYHFIGRLLCCRASLPPPAKPVVPHPYSLLSDAREDDRVRPWELAEDGSKATCRPVEEMLAMIDKNQPGGDTDDQMRIFNRKTAQALEACPSLNTIAHCKFLARWDMKSKQFTSNVLRDAAFLTSIKDEVKAHFQARYTFNKAFGHPVMELGDNVQTTEDFLRRNKIDDPYVAQQFKEHGYDDTTFLVGVKMDDLKSIGVTNMLVSRQMTKKLLDAMGKLNNTGIPDTIPVTIDEWLISLHLDCYHFNFLTLGYQDTEIALLEGLTTPDLHQLGIKKRAHVKKLTDALRKLSKLRDQGRSPEGPSKDAVEEAHTRELVARLETKPLGQSYLVKRHLIQDEQAFWQQMVAERIGAKLENTSNITEMREGLLALRNAAVLVLFVINALWVVLMVELTSSQASSLNIIGTNPLGFFFLVVYGGIFFIQFLTLLWHRGATVTQALAHVHFPPKSDDEVTRLRQSFPV